MQCNAVQRSAVQCMASAVMRGSGKHSSALESKKLTEYTWRAGGPKPNVEANVFGQFIEQIAAGDPIHMVDVETALAAAETREDVRPLFQWDNEKAAHQYRMVQMRHYIGALQTTRVIVEHSPPISHRAMFSVSVSERRGYVGDKQIKGDHDLKKQLIEIARRELDSYLKRYQTIASFGKYQPRLQSIIDDMRDDLDRLSVEAAARSTGSQQSNNEAHETMS